MKISFFFSSSSSSTSYFYGNLRISQNVNAGCFSGILRRVLFNGSLTTLLFDHVKEADQVEYDHWLDSKAEEKIEAPATPGIVARLVGLESMQGINWVPIERTLGSIRRAVTPDYCSEFDPIQGVIAGLGHCCCLENEDFLLTLDKNVDERGELVSKGRKSETVFGELRQKKAERSKNMENSVVSGKNKDKESNKKVSNEKSKPKRRISDEPSRKPGTCDKVTNLSLIPSNKKDVLP